MDSSNPTKRKIGKNKTISLGSLAVHVGDSLLKQNSVSLQVIGVLVPARCVGWSTDFMVGGWGVLLGYTVDDHEMHKNLRESRLRHLRWYLPDGVEG